MNRDELARLRDRENRDEFAIRRQERELAAEERTLEEEMRRFEDDEERAERQIERDLRREHAGRDPEQAPSWQRHGEPPPSRGRSGPRGHGV